MDSNNASSWKEYCWLQMIFTVKYKSDARVEKFKARIIAKVFTKSYSIDFKEMFTLIGKLNIVCVLLSLVVNQDRPLCQLDVKNIFLNGNLKEEVYMQVPFRMENHSNRSLGCKLKKSLYGLSC